jgi:hypothetical protein
MKLEAQLAELTALGFSLEPEVTVDDLLYSFDRESFEGQPFDLLLLALGVEVEREPWGRPFCRRVWNFDLECVEDDGAYVDIVNHLGTLAGADHRIAAVVDHVDLEAAEGWVEYTLDGKRRRHDIEVHDDWADMKAVSLVMAALEERGRRFYAKDNGQAMVFFYLDEQTAKRLNGLSKNALKPVLPYRR